MKTKQRQRRRGPFISLHWEGLRWFLLGLRGLAPQDETPAHRRRRRARVARIMEEARIDQDGNINFYPLPKRRW
jgi:hypothetical protein